MQRICAISGTKFEITAEELEFYQRISPVFNAKKYHFPPPTLSPIERQRRRLSFRNIRTLYRRQCDATGRAIISCHPEDSPHKVFYADEWWSDRWDGLDYGRDFDFSRPFFEQFRELCLEVPLFHLYQTPNENCEYINGASNCRNCYLSFLMDYCEDCYYLTVGNGVRSTLDSFGLTNCELCYECIDCNNCYALRYSNRSSGCSESYFLSNCRECRNCIGCFNLASQEYCVFNRKVSKSEYQELARKLQSASGMQEFKIKFEEFSRDFPRRFYFGQFNESFSGDIITGVRDSYWCFHANKLENCRHCNFFFNSDNSIDVNYFGDGSSWLYECLATGINCTNNSFCMLCWSGSSNNLYSHMLSASSNCFGCSGLKRKNFCILNKQYSEAQYQRLVSQIIEHMQQTGEWGEFFPSTNSSYPINISEVHDYFPMSEAEAAQRGLQWGTRKNPQITGAPIVSADTIEEFPASLVNSPVSCSACGGEFKIIEPEFRFYSTNSIPPPTNCPECRHQARTSLRNPTALWERECSKCRSAISTAYAPDKLFDVYCADCFAAEVY